MSLCPSNKVSESNDIASDFPPILPERPIFTPGSHPEPPLALNANVALFPDESLVPDERDF